MTVYELIRNLEELDPDAEVRIVFNAANPKTAQAIEIKDIIEHDDGVAYIIEDNWGYPICVPKGLLED